MPAIGYPIGAPLDLGVTPAPPLPQTDDTLGALSLVYSDGLLSALPQQDTGSDVSLIGGLNGNWPLQSGDAMLAEDVIRRLTTERGTLDFSPNDGIDVRDFLRDDMSDDDVFQAKQAIESEVLKDERFDDVDVKAAYDATADGGPTLQLALAATKATGGFTLVLSVTQLTVSILSAEAN